MRFLAPRFLLSASASALALLLARPVLAQPLPPGPSPAPTLPPGKQLPPGGFTPIAPGGIQGRAGLAAAPSTAPEVWTFADPKAEPVNPTSARLTWQGRQGAGSYRVYRNDAFLTLVQSTAPLSFVDDTLTPGQLATYYIEAISQSQGPVKAVPRGALSDTPSLTVLETSRKKGAVTPTVDSPRDFGVTITDAQRRTVRATWSAPKWASSIQVLRDGTPLATVAGTATSFDAPAAVPGAHVYSLRALFAAAPSKPTFQSAPTEELRLQLSPFKIVAFGDSIMWGQGLAESAKFTSLTRDAIRSSLGVRRTPQRRRTAARRVRPAATPDLRAATTARPPPTDPVNEDELDRAMDRLAAGDRSAFDPLYVALHPRAVSVARRRLHDDALALDAAQESLIKVFSRASEFARGAHVLPWFYAVCANEIRAIERRRGVLATDATGHGFFANVTSGYMADFPSSSGTVAPPRCLSKNAMS